MDGTTCYCRIPRCPLFGQVAPRAPCTGHDWHRQAPRWRCRACRMVVSARTGTAYAGLRTEGTPSLRGAVALAAGVSIRATGRLLDVDKDTVHHGLPVLGRHCQSVMHYFFRDLPLREGQLDELWTFVAKQEDHRTPLEKLAPVYGDAWVWIACRPGCTLVPAWVVGQRTLQDARRLVFRLQSATAGSMPCFTSDALPHYAAAFLEVSGVWGIPPRRGTRGRGPKPRRDPPPDLCYAGVVKERAQGRVVHVTPRIVSGTTEQVAAAWQALPVSHTINPYGVERNNLTVRQHARRMGRQVKACSKGPDYLDYQLLLAFASYHGVIPHRGLRPRLPHPIPTKGRNGSPKQWKPVTPAMAAGLTAHVWTMEELLSFRVPPQSLW